MNRKDIPTFASEDEEREFWATHDATDYVDFSNAQRAQFPELRPSAKTISLRLPVSLLDSLKVLAHKRDVPYQSLIKLMLAEAVQRDRHGSGLARR
jgi:predicted DNA binding CopG/RHH family protein